MLDLHLGLIDAPVPRSTPKLSRSKVKALALPAPPIQWTWLNRNNGLFNAEGNHNCGDCVIADIAHETQVRTGWTQARPFIATEAQAMAVYTAITCSAGYGGCYDPVTGKNDSGITIDDGFNFWLTQGFGGHKIASYAYINPANANHLQLAIWYFGSVSVVLRLPKTAQDQYYKKRYFDVVSTTGDGAPGSWGLHLVPLFGWGQYSYACISWGDLVGMSKGFLRTYASGAYVSLDPAWRKKDGTTPRGDKWTDLQSFMDAVKY